MTKGFFPPLDETWGSGHSFAIVLSQRMALSLKLHEEAVQFDKA